MNIFPINTAEVFVWPATRVPIPSVTLKEGDLVAAHFYVHDKDGNVKFETEGGCYIPATPDGTEILCVGELSFNTSPYIPSTTQPPSE